MIYLSEAEGVVLGVHGLFVHHLLDHGLVEPVGSVHGLEVLVVDGRDAVSTLLDGEHARLELGALELVVDLGVVGLLELLELDHGAELLDAALECRLVVDVGVPLGPRLVRRENKARSLELRESSLDGDRYLITVEHAQEHVILDPSVELVDEDGLLSVVHVPPEVAVVVGLGEDEGVGIVGCGLAGFARAGLSPEDEDLGGLRGITSLGEDGLEARDAAVEFNVASRVIVGDLAHGCSSLDCIGNGLEVGPALEDIVASAP